VTPEIVWGSETENRRLLNAAEIPERHPVRHFNTYYRLVRREGGVLHRNDIDPANIVPLLPWIQILQETGPRRFTHRLVGTSIVNLLGVDNTGKPFGHGIDERVRDVRLDEFATAFETGAPVFSCSPMMQEDRSFITVICGAFPGRLGDTRLIYLPLADEHREIVV